MDWRNRIYYTVRFVPWNRNERVKQLSEIPCLKLSPYNKEQAKTICSVTMKYDTLIGLDKKYENLIEAKLISFLTLDGFCKWNKILTLDDFYKRTKME